MKAIVLIVVCLLIGNSLAAPKAPGSSPSADTNDLFEEQPPLEVTQLPTPQPPQSKPEKTALVSETPVAQSASPPTPASMDSKTFKEDANFAQESIDDDEVNEQSRRLNVDNFLSRFEVYNCSEASENSAAKSSDELDFNTLCPQILRHSTLNAIGEFDSGHRYIRNYLSNEIYMPLAMNMISRDNVADLLGDVIFGTGSTSLINVRNMDSTFHTFQSKVLRSFEEMTLKSQDFDHYREDINGIIVSILKSFHLYWNSLRASNQFDKARIDTKELLRVLLRSFDVKHKFLAETTRALVEKIREAYYRFVRAHKMVELISKETFDVLVNQILRRFRANLDVLRKERISTKRMVREIDVILRLTQFFHVVLYKKGLSEEVAIEKFRQSVSNAIANEYETRIIELRSVDEERFQVSKKFTIVLLLKMKHLIHIIYRYHRISEFVNLPQMYLEFNHHTSVKVYYELMDNMLMIPRTCVNTLALRNCVLHETNKAKRLIGRKYKLFQSTGGWELMDYVGRLMKNLFARATESEWSSWSLFKHYFYVNLFSALFNFKQKFGIISHESLEELETRVGRLLDDFRQRLGGATEEFALVDKLDQDLYEIFLSIKSDFNRPNTDSDPAAVASAKKTIHDFLYDFLKSSVTLVTENMVRLANEIDSAVMSWHGPGGAKNIVSTSVSKSALAQSIFGDESPKPPDNALVLEMTDNPANPLMTDFGAGAAVQTPAVSTETASSPVQPGAAESIATTEAQPISKKHSSI